MGQYHDPMKSNAPFFFFLVQTKMSWRTQFIIWYSRQRLRIKVQSCPVLQ